MDGAPSAAGAHWAAVVGYGEDGAASGVVATSTDCPGPDAVPLGAQQRLAAVTWPGGTAAVVPLPGVGLSLVVVPVLT